jgi:hypothetical protein
VRPSARRAVAPFAHEVVEFGAILGHAQSLQEALEFLRFLLEPAQRLGAVLVKGAVAG